MDSTAFCIAYKVLMDKKKAEENKKKIIVVKETKL